MHCELAGGQRASGGPARFEVTEERRGAPLKELPRAPGPGAGRALSNPQMSFKTAASSGGDPAEPSAPEMSAPLLDFVPKRASVFERIPALPRAPELRCARASREHFPQQRHPGVKGESETA